MFELESDGTWSLFDWDLDGIPDLIFIRTSNSVSGTVEVSVASGASLFHSLIYHSGSLFKEETHGVWSLTGTGDLTYIKNAFTVSGTTEVYIASKASNYAELSLASWSVFKETTNGF